MQCRFVAQAIFSHEAHPKLDALKTGQERNSGKATGAFYCIDGGYSTH
ncbi:hypothetical protein ACUTRI_10825 [Serratia sp. TSA_130.2]|nr:MULTISPECIES: hypothetical protein [Serratia]EMD1302233.1 hypothetical protein [Serratia marcescens]MBH2655439.1 hypothetical protein [Serratia ureilytica]MBH2658053.1 hypothetical protein [Serratia ureilytica]MBH2700638.1 hypothetical protein [Serratia ureilytica]MBH2734035.1 hypothetical protein [Serratia ureilytica]